MATRFKIGIHMLDREERYQRFSKSTDIRQVLNELPTDKRHVKEPRERLQCHTHVDNNEKNIFKRVTRPNLSGVSLTVTVSVAFKNGIRVGYDGSCFNAHFSLLPFISLQVCTLHMKCIVHVNAMLTIMVLYKPYSLYTKILLLYMIIVKECCAFNVFTIVEVIITILDDT